VSTIRVDQAEEVATRHIRQDEHVVRRRCEMGEQMCNLRMHDMLQPRADSVNISHTRGRGEGKERSNTNAKNFDFSNEAHSRTVPILHVVRAWGQLDSHKSIIVRVLLGASTIVGFGCRRRIEIMFHDRLSTNDTIMTTSSDGAQRPASVDKRYR
jgi:hypothetical protein